MADVKNNIIWTLRDNVSATAAKLNHQLDGLGVRSKGATGVLSKMGVATGGLITPFSLGAAGALALAGGVVAVGRAAIEEEKNIAKLDAALQANIPGWDGNRDAIERLISAREKLAFSDDDQRDSLALLVGATHDVAKAQAIQATAMDLARFKGISLMEASEALTKVEAGSYRILKSLGIALKDGATQTDALAAVQRVAGGQAKKYGDTTAGAMESAQIAIDDLAEEIGTGLLPVIKDLAIGLREDVIPAARGVGDVIGPLLGGLGELASGLHGVNEEGDKLFGLDTIRAFNDAQKAAGDTATAMGGAGGAVHALGREGGLLGQTLHETARAADNLGDAVEDASSRGRVSMGKMADGVRGLRDAFRSAAGDIIDDYYDPIIARAELTATKTEIADLRRIASSRKLTNEEKQHLAELEQKQAHLLLELGSTADLSMGEINDAIDEWSAKAATAHGKEQERVRATLRQWVLLKLGILAAKRAYNNSGLVKPGDSNRATGGPVWPGSVYTVGEEGPETLVMGSGGGFVIPNSGSSGSGGGGMGGVSIVYSPQFSTASAAEAQRFMRAIVPELTRELRRQSLA